MGRMDDLVRVYVAASAVEGQIVKGRLEVEGIPVLLKSEGEGPYRTGPAELFVPASFEPQARLVLESVEDDGGTSDGETPDDEPDDEGDAPAV
jgi:hypothetical protein